MCELRLGDIPDVSSDSRQDAHGSIHGESESHIEHVVRVSQYDPRVFEDLCVDGKQDSSLYTSTHYEQVIEKKKRDHLPAMPPSDIDSSLWVVDHSDIENDFLLSNELPEISFASQSSSMLSSDE